MAKRRKVGQKVGIDLDRFDAHGNPLPKGGRPATRVYYLTTQRKKASHSGRKNKRFKLFYGSPSLDWKKVRPR